MGGRDCICGCVGATVSVGMWARLYLWVCGRECICGCLGVTVSVGGWALFLAVVERRGVVCGERRGSCTWGEEGELYVGRGGGEGRRKIGTH